MMYRCLKCGYKMKDKISLCPDCLVEEFKKMDNGESSGYLYAAEMYHQLKEKGVRKE